jgi:hypothetical protein
MNTNNSSGQIKNIVKTSLSNIIAGFILLIVSIFIYLDMFDVIRNPIFNASLGILFLYLAFINFNFNKYHTNTEKLFNSDLNGIIVGLSLLIISIIGALGHMEIVRNVAFPLVSGVLLMVVAVSRIYFKAYSNKVKINRIDPCGIVGGELLIFYAVLLYLDFTALIWSPVFPIFVSAALYTALFIDVIALTRSNQSGINDVTIWLDEIGEKISDIRIEFESIKLAHDDPQLSKSLERLVELQKKLMQLKAMTASQIAETPSKGELTDLIDTKQTGKTKHDKIHVEKVKVSTKPDDSLSNIEPSDLKELIGHNSSDEIFYENLMKEFELSGMSDIIKEVKEMRNSLVFQGKKEE